MAIGKGSMARAAKTVKAEVKADVKKEVAVETKVAGGEKPAAKKSPVKKTATSVITPNKQVTNMVTSEKRCEIGQEMPIYLL